MFKVSSMIYLGINSLLRKVLDSFSNIPSKFNKPGQEESILIMIVQLTRVWLVRDSRSCSIQGNTSRWVEL